MRKWILGTLVSFLAVTAFAQLAGVEPKPLKPGDTYSFIVKFKQPISPRGIDYQFVLQNASNEANQQEFATSYTQGSGFNLSAPAQKEFELTVNLPDHLRSGTWVISKIVVHIQTQNFEYTIAPEQANGVGFKFVNPATDQKKPELEGVKPK